MTIFSQVFQEWFPSSIPLLLEDTLGVLRPHPSPGCGRGAGVSSRHEGQRTGSFSWAGTTTMARGEDLPLLPEHGIALGTCALLFLG